ncbi:MAG: hypothetical protein ACI9S8_001509 [Chlamydiales bacterium]|jgi:hypothetical protein
MTEREEHYLSLDERLELRKKDDVFFPVKGPTRAVHHEILIQSVKRPILSLLTTPQILQKAPSKSSTKRLAKCIARLLIYKDSFENRFGQAFEASESEGLFLFYLDVLKKACGVQEVSEEGIESVEYTLLIMEEIFCEDYPFKEAMVFINWSIQISRSFLLGGPLEKQETVDEFFYRIVENTDSYYIVERPKEESGHSPSFYLMDHVSHQPFAILKRTLPLHLCSFEKRVPIMKRTAPLHEVERVGFEMNKIIGVFQHTPVTLQAHFRLNGEDVEGSIQFYLSNTFAGRRDFYYLETAAEELLTLSNGVVHSAVLEGLIQQRGAGHGDNIIVSKKPHQGKTIINDLYAIDLEEILPRYTRLRPDIYFTDAERAKEREGDSFDEEIYSALTLCRIWLLGLPQSQRPVRKALLMMGSNPSMAHSINDYADFLFKTSNLEVEGIEALKERVSLISDICSKALKEKNYLTPREMYFEIYGGKKLYESALRAGIYPLEIFDQVVGNPYSNFKDFADIEGSLEDFKSFVFDETKNEEENLIMKETFRKLYEVELFDCKKPLFPLKKKPTTENRS